jgi:hypothetical protein
LFELAFQALKQSKRVGGGTCESADHITLAESADLLGIGFNNSLANRDLTISADNHAAALADS